MTHPADDATHPDEATHPDVAAHPDDATEPAASTRSVNGEGAREQDQAGEQPSVRRIGARRVVLGDVPTQRAPGSKREGTLADGRDDDRPEAWGDASSEREEDRWLREQRPPHWG